MDIKERIMEATIEEIGEKSMKFTMDDIAKRLSISKKTIYAFFTDKETLLLETADYGFSKVKESEKAIMEDSTIDCVEKLKRIIIVLPDKYKNIDWRQIYQIKEKYPKIYDEITRRIENDWEDTIALIEEGQRLGRIRPINIKIFKMMVESVIENFISRNSLIADNISYEEALSDMRDILINGICV